jgi:hypothetical protein
MDLRNARSVQNVGNSHFLRPSKDDRIDRKTTTRVLSIDSLFRKNYQSTKSTDFTYNLPDPINKVTSLKIASIEFPNSWYTFSTENGSNSFIITLYNCPTPDDRLNEGITYDQVTINTIIIPDGNYRSDLLAASINNIFSNSRNGLEYLFFDINEINAKCVFRTKVKGDTNGDNYIIKYEENPDFYFTVDFVVPSMPKNPLYKNAGWMMGFKQPFYTINLNSATPKTVIDGAPNDGVDYVYYWYQESESSYGSSIQNYIFLEIDDFNRNSTANTFFSKTINDAYLGNNIMGRITVTSGINTIVTMDGGNLLFKTREYFGPIRLEKLHIRLIDKYGDPVNLEGNDFSFMLEIEQLYSN